MNCVWSASWARSILSEKSSCAKLNLNRPSTWSSAANSSSTGLVADLRGLRAVLMARCILAVILILDRFGFLSYRERQIITLVSCHVVFDKLDWSIQRVQFVCTLVCADTLSL